MSVENIEKKILESAKAEAETALAQAEEQAKARLDAAKAENEARAADAAEETRERLQQEHDQRTTSARAANKLRLLAHKARILDEIFGAAVERFIGDRSGKYAEWFAARIESVANETGRILPAEPDRAIVEKLLDKHGGKGLELADESLPLQGGFVLKGEKVDVDLSLDSQLAEMKADLMPELARRAFGVSDAS